MAGSADTLEQACYCYVRAWALVVPKKPCLTTIWNRPVIPTSKHERHWEEEQQRTTVTQVHLQHPNMRYRARDTFKQICLGCGPTTTIVSTVLSSVKHFTQLSGLCEFLFPEKISYCSGHQGSSFSWRHSSSTVCTVWVVLWVLGGYNSLFRISFLLQDG